MSEKGNRRPFATGSKPGPDEIDHYLEQRGYYRKHVARDASSLFRVVSEQILDIQNYHEQVRQECASFMEAHVKDYANEVDKNFYNYVSNLRRVRTYGTLLELRVMARMYKRNVTLFEPTLNYQTSERVYVHDDAYDKFQPIRVFYSHKDKHFDTIFTMNYVEVLAECQAIVYDILYTSVFKLPDVKYAVERMLHDQDEESTLPLPDDPSKFKTAGGEIIAFDSAETTNCVLKDPRTCHFHNQTDFEEVVQENKDAITIINRSDDPGRLKIFKPIDGFLYKKDKSCVRQLLDEKITPFPYKVAKALDPSIYRNTEFELWSENRKEQRIKWLDSNGLPLKDDEKLWSSVHDFDKSRRAIQYQMRKFPFESIEETYQTIDEDGKKKYVIVNPGEDYKLGHLVSLDHFQPYNQETIVMPANVNHNNHNYYRNNNRRNFPRRNYHVNHGNYTSDVDRDSYSYTNDHDHVYNQQQPHHQIYTEAPPQGNYPYVQYDNSPPPLFPNPPPQYYAVPQTQYQHQIPSTVPYAPQVYNPPVMHYSYASQTPVPAPLFTYPPPAAPTTTTSSAQPKENNDSMNLIRDGELSSSNVNYQPKESTDQNGADLPMNDIPTLQFYYNLGVRYFFAAGVQRRLESVANQMENLDVNAGTDHNSLDVKTDQHPPSVPQNTPVSTKPVASTNVSGPSGHRFHSGNNNYNRRNFNRGEQRDGGNNGNKRNNNYSYNQRKEIQFNSNVKNLHKVESNTNLQKQSSTNQTSASALTVQVQSMNITETIETSNLLATATLTPNVSQISPISPPNDIQSVSSEQGQQHQTFQQQLAPLPQYQSYSMPQPLVSPTQPFVYFQTESGELLSVQPPVQPVYYSYAQPPSPYYYQPSPQIAAPMDNTMNSNDSGVVEMSAANYQTAYAQQSPAFPIIYNQPIYYPQTPLIPQTPILQTPHIAQQIAPIYPIANTGPPAATTLQAQSSGIVTQHGSTQVAVAEPSVSSISDSTQTANGST